MIDRSHPLPEPYAAFLHHLLRSPNIQILERLFIGGQKAKMALAVFQEHDAEIAVLKAS